MFKKLKKKSFVILKFKICNVNKNFLILNFYYFLGFFLILFFRLHARLIDYFGRELDLDDPRYQKCFCCSHSKSFSKIVVIG